MKKTTRKVLALLWAAGLAIGGMTGCSAEQPAETTVNTASPAAETTGGAEEAAVALYDPGFKIERLSDGIKRVTDGDGRELILVPKALGKIPAEYEDSIVITTPVENAVFLSSTQVCTFRTANDPGLLDRIGGVTGSADSWGDIPGIAQRLENGKILDVTGDGDMMEPDYEKIQTLEPDVVFVYTGEYGQQTTIAKL